MEVLFIMDTSGSFISPLQSVFSFFAKQYSTGLQSRKNRDIFMPSLNTRKRVDFFDVLLSQKSKESSSVRVRESITRALQNILKKQNQPICFVDYAKLQWKDWFENSYRMLAEGTLFRLACEAKSEVTPIKSKRYPENWIGGKTVFINRATVADEKVDVAGRVEKYIANIGFNTVHKASRNNLGRRAREKITWGSLSAGQSFRHERLLAA